MTSLMYILTVLSDSGDQTDLKLHIMKHVAAIFSLNVFFTANAF